MLPPSPVNGGCTLWIQNVHCCQLSDTFVLFLIRHLAHFLLLCPHYVVMFHLSYCDGKSHLSEQTLK